jgi:ABC-type sugar transport system ATPase subunit
LLRLRQKSRSIERLFCCDAHAFNTDDAISMRIFRHFCLKARMDIAYSLLNAKQQPIAIARALLKRPKIVIFDEATSNLDQHTAESFAKTINALKGKVTMLFITHALPKSLQIDEVIENQQGGGAADEGGASSSSSGCSPGICKDSCHPRTASVRDTARHK